MNTRPPVDANAVDLDNPWPGLATFSEAQRQFFFGRDEEAEELVRRLTSKALTVLFGQSGLGKSSLLQAGVFPRLRNARFVPVYVRLDHGAEAPVLIEQIKAVVAADTGLMGTWLGSDTPVDGESLWAYFHHLKRELRNGSGQPLVPVLVFDQFEEIFTLGAADDHARTRVLEFIGQLADLVENRPPLSFEARIDAGEVNPSAFDFARDDYRVLITLREDYLPHLESLRVHIPSVMQNRMRLTRLSGTQALEAVLRPAPGLVADDVARAIVTFVSGRNDLAQADVEPSLLSLVCRELNYRRLAIGAAQIDAALLEGSRETILTEFYERTLADQPPAVRGWIESELLTDSGYRENVGLERAKKTLIAAGVNPTAIDVLVSRRLLRIEERLDVRRIELTHDVLCGIVKASRDTRHEREAKEAAARQLAETQAQQTATRRALLRARGIAAGCAVLALVAIAAAVWGYLNQRRAHAAEHQARAAEEAAVQTRELAETARRQAETLVSYLIKDLEPTLEQYGRLPQLRQLAEKAIDYYQSLPPSVRTIDTLHNEAKARLILMGVQDAQGDRAAFKESVKTIVGLLEKVLAVNPDPELEAYLISTKAWEYDSNLKWFGPDDEAYFTAAQNKIRALAVQHADNLDVVRAAAKLRSQLVFYVDVGSASRNLQSLVDSANSVRAEWERIIAREPENRTNRIWYAHAISFQGAAYSQVKDYERSLACSREAVAYVEDALKPEPGNVALLEAAARAAQYLSYQAGAVDRKLMAEAELIAREHNRVLVQIDPTNQIYRSWFVASHRMEGYALQAEGRWKEARAASLKFVALYDALPNDAQQQLGRGIDTQVCVEAGLSASGEGDFAGARALLEESNRRLKVAFPVLNLEDLSVRSVYIKREVQQVSLLLNNARAWSDAEKTATAVLPLIEVELKRQADSPEFLLRRAETHAELGWALLGQKRFSEAASILGQAVAEFDLTPPTVSALSYTRAIDTLNTRERWGEALNAIGDRPRAKKTLEDALVERARNLARENIWDYQRTWARTAVLLAATLDPQQEGEHVRRRELLDRANGLLAVPGEEKRLAPDDRDTLAKIATLRNEL